MRNIPTVPSLLSDTHGRLRRVLLSMPWWIVRYRHQEEFAPMAACFEGLLAALPEYTEVVVATRSESVAGLHDWMSALSNGRRIRVVAVSDDFTLTAWAQDACLVARDPGGRAFLAAPADFGRQDDARVLAAVAADLGILHRSTSLAFQGGNVLVGDDFWLVGEDSLHETVAQGLAPDRDAALAAFSAELGGDRRLHGIGTDDPLAKEESRPIDGPAGRPGDGWAEIVRRGSIEGTFQPIFDLDTFVSLAGRDEDGVYRVLVGDPAMAADIMETDLPDHANAGAFDDVADQLTRLGFRVFRNPLPLVYHDDVPARTRLWYFASANNVLTEIADGVRNVWIPSYESPEWRALSRTDARNADIWRALGFTPHPLPGFGALARDLGAARCLCKSLER